MNILHRHLAHPTLSGIIPRLRAQGRQNQGKRGIFVHPALYGTHFLEIVHRSVGMTEPHWNREPALLRE
eukprot:2399420-Alexandrium_andersonii.AAC.1